MHIFVYVFMLICTYVCMYVSAFSISTSLACWHYFFLSCHLQAYMRIGASVAIRSDAPRHGRLTPQSSLHLIRSMSRHALVRLSCFLSFISSSHDGKDNAHLHINESYIANLPPIPHPSSPTARRAQNDQKATHNHKHAGSCASPFSGATSTSVTAHHA
jgi:hypothetical protein